MRAFTLIEALLALALTALLAGSIFGFVSSLAENRKQLVAAAHREDGAGVLCEQLEAGLLCAVAGDKSLGGGVKGDATSIHLVSRGVRVPLPGESPAGDLMVSEYALSGGAVAAKRWELGQTAPQAEPVVEHVKQLRLRYHNGSSWVDSFDSLASNTLPAAVEVSIWFGDPPPAPADGEPGRELTDPGPPDRSRIIALPDGPGGELKGAP
jgi:type II secretory pathway component PulJ